VNERSLGGLPVTGWLAIVLAMVGVLVWKQAPLDPRRSPEAPVPEARMQALQDVNARLWEDPFGAVMRVRRVPPTGMPPDAGGIRSLESVCGQLLAESRGGEFHLQVLAAMVSNAPYSDGEERRRRTRYAVQSALSVGHFVPENPDHLGYFNWRGLTDIPFEMFRRKNTGRDRFLVLVLWLEDEAVTWTDGDRSGTQAGERQPVRQLALLRDAVRTHCVRDGDRNGGERFGFAVLGPAGSHTLREMTRELQAEERRPAAQRRGFGEPFDLYSAAATAPAKEFMGSQSDEAAARACRSAPDEWYCRLGWLFQAHGLRFHRVIATDDAAADALVEELGRRGVAVRASAGNGAPDGHVAIVSERDTYYGRRLPIVFLRAAGQEAGCETDPSERAPGEQAPGEPCRVLRFSYLRGLDGEGPRPATATPAGTSAARGLPSGIVEPSEGLSQFDYLRRLATRIAEEDRRLRRAGRGGIGAVGVLGSDLFDKLALLRALRPALPGAVFFTTDLDARLLGAQHLEWTRNLVVASSFGLELAPCLQKDVPPFRDVYQTAAFLGVRVALFNAMPSGSPFRDDLCPGLDGAADLAAPGVSRDTRTPAPRIGPAQLDAWLARARLFELGRTGPVALDDVTGGCASLAACDQIHPPERRTGRGADQFLLGLGAVGFVVALLTLVRATRPIVLRPFVLAMDCLARGSLAQRAGAALALLSVIGPPAAVVWWGLGSIRDPQGEPFYWVEGVSIWPSVLLRVGGIVLGACFLAYLLSEADRSARRLAQRFSLGGAPDHRPVWRMAAGLLDVRADPGSRGQAAVLWAQYARSGRPVWRLARSVGWVLLFSLAAGALLGLTGYPHNPARGATAVALEQVVRLSLLLLFLLVLFAVNDAIRLCRNLVVALTTPRAAGDWPPEACRDFGESLGLPEDLPAPARDALLDAWIDTRFAAEITADIGPLLLFPFVLLGLLIAAYWPVTDNWDLAPGLVVVMAASFVLACINAIEMQRAASRARRSALRRLGAMALRAGAGGEPKGPSVPFLQALIRSVETLREGAFVPFVEQPLVRAALIPFSSAGGLYLMDLFALAT